MHSRQGCFPGNHCRYQDQCWLQCWEVVLGTLRNAPFAGLRLWPLHGDPDTWQSVPTPPRQNSTLPSSRVNLLRKPLLGVSPGRNKFLFISNSTALATLVSWMLDIKYALVFNSFLSEYTPSKRRRFPLQSLLHFKTAKTELKVIRTKYIHIRTTRENFDQLGLDGEYRGKMLSFKQSTPIQSPAPLQSNSTNDPWAQRKEWVRSTVSNEQIITIVIIIAITMTDNG